VDRQNVLPIVISICIFNGIFSPFLMLAIPITAVLMPELFPREIQWVLFWSSILISSATLLFSGVPAALYERLVERDPEASTSAWIWLAGAVALTVPAVLRVL
jgi:hypothetical protein